MPISHPDAIARLAQAWADGSAAPPLVFRVVDRPCPPGFATFTVGGSASLVVLPALVPDAPPPVLRRYLARVIAAGTGECPLCHQVAGLDPPGPPGPGEPRVAWHLHPVTVRVVHAPGCPAIFTDDDHRWFDGRCFQ